MPDDDDDQGDGDVPRPLSLPARPTLRLPGPWVVPTPHVIDTTTHLEPDSDRDRDVRNPRTGRRSHRPGQFRA